MELKPKSIGAEPVDARFWKWQRRSRGRMLRSQWARLTGLELSPAFGMYIAHRFGKLPDQDGALDL